MKQLTKDQIDRIAQIRVELAAINQSLGTMDGGCRALERAVSWLGDVTLPLTPQEQDQWATCSYLADTLEDMDAASLNETMTEDDRREALHYMRDDGESSLRLMESGRDEVS